MLATLDRLVEQGQGIPLEGGANDCFLLELDGAKIAYKVLANLPFERFIRTLEFSLSRRLVAKVPAQSSKALGAKGVIAREVLTVLFWKQHGIPTPEVLGYDEKSVAYGFVDGKDYEKILKGSFEEAKYSRLLSTISAVRSLAFGVGDKNILHPDQRPGNFLYDAESDLELAIDPGIIIRDDLTIEEADAIGNLFFCMDLLSKKIPNAEYKIERLLETIEPDQIELMAEVNKPVGIIPRAYLGFRERAGDYVRQRPRRGYFSNYNGNARLLGEIIRSQI